MTRSQREAPTPSSSAAWFVDEAVRRNSNGTLRCLLVAADGDLAQALVAAISRPASRDHVFELALVHTAARQSRNLIAALADARTLNGARVELRLLPPAMGRGINDQLFAEGEMACNGSPMSQVWDASDGTGFAGKAARAALAMAWHSARPIALKTRHNRRGWFSFAFARQRPSDALAVG